MKILYVSVLCSQKKIDDLFLNTNKDPGFAVQKFNKLFVQGLVLNDCKIETLSTLPINNSTHKKKYWKRDKETIDGTCFNYLSFVNLPLLRQLFIFVGSFYNTIKWSFYNEDDQKVIICDVLNTSAVMGALLGAKICNLKVIGIVTDIPGMQTNSLGVNLTKRCINSVVNSIQYYFLNSYSLYVLLTEQMNEKINKYGRPYIVIEGLVDVNMKGVNLTSEPKLFRNIIYAGSLNERYGIKKLIDSFRNVKGEDLRLSIYGSGDVEKDLYKYMKLDKRLYFYGIVANSEIVKAQLEATLLVNPRPTDELYTRYSFPSKNMEYMVSGTPVLTTKLAGMPTEYYEYVFLLDDESEEGFVNSLSTVLELSDEELYENGRKAREFVLTKKNNMIQTKKVIEMINSSMLS